MGLGYIDVDPCFPEGDDFQLGADGRLDLFYFMLIVRSENELDLFPGTGTVLALKSGTGMYEDRGSYFK